MEVEKSRKKFWPFQKKCLTLPRLILKHMRQTTTPTPAVLTFRRGKQTATAVSDGRHHATYHPVEGRKWHRKLSSAIAHLETLGFAIETDSWE